MTSISVTVKPSQSKGSPNQRQSTTNEATNSDRATPPVSPHLSTTERVEGRIENTAIRTQLKFTTSPERPFTVFTPVVRSPENVHSRTPSWNNGESPQKSSKGEGPTVTHRQTIHSENIVIREHRTTTHASSIRPITFDVTSTVSTPSLSPDPRSTGLSEGLLTVKRDDDLRNAITPDLSIPSVSPSPRVTEAQFRNEMKYALDAEWAENRKLTDRVHVLQLNVHKLKQEVLDKDALIAKLKEPLDSNSDIDSSSRRIRHLTLEKASTEATNKALQAEVTELRVQLSQQHSAYENELSAQYRKEQALAAKVQALNSTMNQYSAQVTQFLAELSHFYGETFHLQHLLVASIKEYSATLRIKAPVDGVDLNECARKAIALESGSRSSSAEPSRHDDSPSLHSAEGEEVINLEFISSFQKESSGTMLKLQSLLRGISSIHVAQDSLNHATLGEMVRVREEVDMMARELHEARLQAENSVKAAAGLSRSLSEASEQMRQASACLDIQQQGFFASFDNVWNKTRSIISGMTSDWFHNIALYEQSERRLIQQYDGLVEDLTKSERLLQCEKSQSATLQGALLNEKQKCDKLSVEIEIITTQLESLRTEMSEKEAAFERSSERDRRELEQLKLAYQRISEEVSVLHSEEKEKRKAEQAFVAQLSEKKQQLKQEHERAVAEIMAAHEVQVRELESKVATLESQVATLSVFELKSKQAQERVRALECHKMVDLAAVWKESIQESSMEWVYGLKDCERQARSSVMKYTTSLNEIKQLHELLKEAEGRLDDERKSAFTTAGDERKRVLALESEVNRLQGLADNAKRELKENTDELKRLLEEERAEHFKELERRKFAEEQRISAYRIRVEQQLLEEKDQYLCEVKKLKSEVEVRESKFKLEYETRIETLENSLATQNTESLSTKTVSRHQGELDGFATASVSAKEDLFADFFAFWRGVLQASLSFQSSIAASHADLASELGEAKKQVSQLNDTLAEEKKRLTVVEVEMAQTVTQLANKKRELSEKESEWKAALDKVCSGNTELHLKYEKAVREMRERQAQEQEREQVINQRSVDTEEQINKLKAHYQSAIADLKASHSDAVANLTNEHLQKIGEAEDKVKYVKHEAESALHDFIMNASLESRERYKDWVSDWFRSGKEFELESRRTMAQVDGLNAEFQRCSKELSGEREESARMRSEYEHKLSSLMAQKAKARVEFDEKEAVMTTQRRDLEEEVTRLNTVMGSVSKNWASECEKLATQAIQIEREVQYRAAHATHELNLKWLKDWFTALKQAELIDRTTTTSLERLRVASEQHEVDTDALRIATDGLEEALAASNDKRKQLEGEVSRLGSLLLSDKNAAEEQLELHRLALEQRALDEEVRAKSLKSRMEMQIETLRQSHSGQLLELSEEFNASLAIFMKEGSNAMAEALLMAYKKLQQQTLMSTESLMQSNLETAIILAELSAESSGISQKSEKADLELREERKKRVEAEETVQRLKNERTHLKTSFHGVASSVVSTFQSMYSQYHDICHQTRAHVHRLLRESAHAKDMFESEVSTLQDELRNAAEELKRFEGAVSAMRVEASKAKLQWEEDLRQLRQSHASEKATAIAEEVERVTQLVAGEAERKLKAAEERANRLKNDYEKQILELTADLGKKESEWVQTLQIVEGKQHTERLSLESRFSDLELKYTRLQEETIEVTKRRLKEEEARVKRLTDDFTEALERTIQEERTRSSTEESALRSRIEHQQFQITKLNEEILCSKTEHRVELDTVRSSFEYVIEQLKLENVTSTETAAKTADWLEGMRASVGDCVAAVMVDGKAALGRTVLEYRGGLISGSLAALADVRELSSTTERQLSEITVTLTEERAKRIAAVVEVERLGMQVRQMTTTEKEHSEYWETTLQTVKQEHTFEMERRRKEEESRIVMMKTLQEEQLNAERETHKSIQSQCESLLKEYRETMESKIAVLEREITSHVSALRSADEELNKLRTALQIESDEASRVRVETNELKIVLDTKERQIEGLRRDQLSSLESSVQRAAIEGDLQRMSSELKDATALVAVWESRCTKAESERTTLNSEVRHTAHSLAILETSVADLFAYVGSLIQGLYVTFATEKASLQFRFLEIAREASHQQSLLQEACDVKIESYRGLCLQERECVSTAVAELGNTLLDSRSELSLILGMRMGFFQMWKEAFAMLMDQTANRNVAEETVEFERQRVALLRHSQSQLERDLQQFKQEANQLARDLEVSKQANSELEEKYLRAISSLHQIDVTKAAEQSELEVTLIASLDALRTQNSDLTRDLQRLTSQIEQHEIAESKMRTECDGLRKAIAGCERELREASNEAAAVVVERDAALRSLEGQSATIEEMRTQSATSKKKVANLEAALEEATAICEAERASAREVEAARLALHSRLEFAERLKADGERDIRRLTSQHEIAVSELHAECDELRKSLADSEKELRELSATRAAISEERDAALRQLAVQNATLEEIHTQVAEVKRRAESIETSAGEATARYEAERDAGNEARALQACAEAEAAQARDEVAKLRLALDEANLALQAQLKLAEHLKAEGESLTSQHEQHDVSRSLLRSECDELRKALTGSERELRDASAGKAAAVEERDIALQSLTIQNATLEEIRSQVSLVESALQEALARYEAEHAAATEARAAQSCAETDAAMARDEVARVQLEVDNAKLALQAQLEEADRLKAERERQRDTSMELVTVVEVQADGWFNQFFSEMEEWAYATKEATLNSYLQQTALAAIILPEVEAFTRKYIEDDFNDITETIFEAFNDGSVNVSRTNDVNIYISKIEALNGEIRHIRNHLSAKEHEWEVQRVAMECDIYMEKQNVQELTEEIQSLTADRDQLLKYRDRRYSDDSDSFYNPASPFTREAKSHSEVNMGSVTDKSPCIKDVNEDSEIVTDLKSQLDSYSKILDAQGLELDRERGARRHLAESNQELERTVKKLREREFADQEAFEDIPKLRNQVRNATEINTLLNEEIKQLQAALSSERQCVHQTTISLQEQLDIVQRLSDQRVVDVETIESLRDELRAAIAEQRPMMQATKDSHRDAEDTPERPKISQGSTLLSHLTSLPRLPQDFHLGSPTADADGSPTAEPSLQQALQTLATAVWAPGEWSVFSTSCNILQLLLGRRAAENAALTWLAAHARGTAAARGPRRGPKLGLLFAGLCVDGYTSSYIDEYGQSVGMDGFTPPPCGVRALAGRIASQPTPTTGVRLGAGCYDANYVDGNGLKPGCKGFIPPLTGVADPLKREAKAGGLAHGFDMEYRDCKGHAPDHPRFIPPCYDDNWRDDTGRVVGEEGFAPPAHGLRGCVNNKPLPAGCYDMAYRDINGRKPGDVGFIPLVYRHRGLAIESMQTLFPKGYDDNYRDAKGRGPADNGFQPPQTTLSEALPRVLASVACMDESGTVTTNVVCSLPRELHSRAAFVPAFYTHKYLQQDGKTPGDSGFVPPKWGTRAAQSATCHPLPQGCYDENYTDKNGLRPGDTGFQPPVNGVSDLSKHETKLRGLLHGYDEEYRDRNGLGYGQLGFIPPCYDEHYKDFTGRSVGDEGFLPPAHGLRGVSFRVSVGLPEHCYDECYRDRTGRKPGDLGFCPPKYRNAGKCIEDLAHAFPLGYDENYRDFIGLTPNDHFFTPPRRTGSPYVAYFCTTWKHIPLIPVVDDDVFKPLDNNNAGIVDMLCNWLASFLVPHLWQLPHWRLRVAMLQQYIVVLSQYITVEQGQRAASVNFHVHEAERYSARSEFIEQGSSDSRTTTYPYFGIEVTDGVKIHSIGKQEYHGVKVVGVKGPALYAGLRSNDMIKSVNGIPTSSLCEFQEAVMNCTPGAPVVMSVLRAGHPMLCKLHPTTSHVVPGSGSYTNFVTLRAKAFTESPSPALPPVNVTQAKISDLEAWVNQIKSPVPLRFAQEAPARSTSSHSVSTYDSVSNSHKSRSRSATSGDLPRFASPPSTFEFSTTVRVTGKRHTTMA